VTIVKKILIAVFLLISRPVVAQEFERRLVPVTVRDVPGMFGTTWTTLLEGMNEHDNVLIRGLNYFGPTLAPVADIPWVAPQHSTSPGDPPGSIIYVPREHADAVHVAVTLRQASSSGTDHIPIPAIRESEFSDSPVFFTGLRREKNERTHLRIYSLDLDKEKAAVRVQVIGLGSSGYWSTRYDAVVPLGVKQTISGWPQPLPVRPWAAELLLDPLLDQSLIASSGNEPVQYGVIVSPVTPALRIWALLSETHNETQRVQIALPQ
jgi:hypothetical protein